MDILLARSVTLGQSVQLSTCKHFSLNRTITSKEEIVLNCNWTTKSWYNICQIDVVQLFDLKVLTLTGVLCLNAGPTSSHKKGPGFFPGI